MDCVALPARSPAHGTPRVLHLRMRAPRTVLCAGLGRWRSDFRGAALGSSEPAPAEQRYSRNCMPELNWRRRSQKGVRPLAQSIRIAGLCGTSRTVRFKHPGCDSETASSCAVASPGVLSVCRGCSLRGKESGEKPTGPGSRRPEPVAYPTKGAAEGAAKATYRAHPSRREVFAGLSNPADHNVVSGPAGPLEWTGFVSACRLGARPSGGRMHLDGITSDTQHLR